MLLLPHPLATQTHPGFLAHEQVTETWYKLTPEEAGQQLHGDKFLAHILPRANELPGGWIKLITHEAQNLTTGEKRFWQQVSLRPYLQGYGCDGSTDLNIHVLANCLCARQSLSYPQLMAAAYPQENAPTRDYGWLEDELRA
ncbi:MAG: hypothetical protein ACE5GO_10030 [Anaerolineales bacterium]